MPTLIANNIAKPNSVLIFISFTVGDNYLFGGEFYQ